jgi:tetratricopeptide (TPR) repeat protein
MYAVGVTLFHLLTADFPVSGRNFQQVRSEHAAGKTRFIAQLRPDLDPRFCGVIDLLLSPAPADRPPAGKLVAQLTACCAGQPEVHKNQRFGMRQAVIAAITLALTTGAGVLSREPLHDWFNPLPDREQIAVLPHTNGNMLEDALADSLAESLSSQLARLEKLDARLLVIPAADLRRDRVVSAEDAARRFDANLSLVVATASGSGRTSLNLQLIESANHRVLRTRRAVLQANEAHLLPARAFELALQMIGVGRAVRTPPVEPTTNPEAFRLTEEGKYLAGRNSPAQLDKALDVLQRALAADPRYPSAYAALANAYAQKYKYTKKPEILELALTNAARALELNNHIAAPYVARARVNSTVGKIDDALADVSVALTLDPENPEARLIRAECLQKENRTADAEKAYLELRRLRPNYWLVHNRLGALYVQQARYDDAEKAFERVTHIMPNSASGFKNLGAVYVAMGRNADAAAALEKSLTIEETPEAYTNLGIVYTRQQRLRDAVRSYEKATRLRPSDHRYWRNLGDVLALLPDRNSDAARAWRNALRLAEQELSVDPHNTQAAVSCGLYQAKLSDRAQAIRYATRPDVKDSSDVNVQFKRALVYELSEDRDGALQLLRSLVKSGFSMGEIEQAPELRSLRQDERFAALSRAAAP